MARREAFFGRWAGFQASVNTQQYKYIRVNTFLSSIPSLVTALTNMAVLGAGVYLVLHGSFTVGMVMAFQGFMSSFMSPANSLIAAGQSFQEMITQMERVDDVMSYPTDPYLEDRPKTAEYQKLTGEIEMKDIVFGYAPLGAPLITDFSLKVKPGQKIALVGRSGCGKSTLLRLLLGFEKPESGAIFYDRKDIQTLDLGSLRKLIGTVLQEGELFGGSIYENITISAPNLELKDAWAAAEIAGIAEDIKAMPMGMSTVLQEGGVFAELVERQRLDK